MQLFDGYALLVGAGKFFAPLPSLKPANINAEVLYQTLTIQSGYRAANTTRLVSQEATRAQILSRLASSLPPVVKPSTLLLFYFSGYGCLEVETGRYFLLPFDVDPHNLAHTALEVDDLVAALANLPTCRKLVILDCNPLLLDQLEPWNELVGLAYSLVPPPPEVLRRFCGPGEWAALSAAEADQLSLVDRQSGGSLFTAEIVDVLAGEVAGIKAGVLQLDTLLEHLVELVAHTAFRIYHCEQRPTAQLTGQSFPVALIFGTLKGFEPAPEEHHGQHAKPPDHFAQLPETAVQAPDSTAQGEESFSFGIGADEPSGPVMRGDGGAKGIESGPPTAGINTGGGAAINGDVSTGGGDFAGRDLIKNNVSAKYVIYLNNDQGAQIGDNLALLKDQIKGEPDEVIEHLSLRLAVAAPKRVYVHESFQIAAGIRLPKSPALVVNGLPNVTVDEFTALQTQKDYIQLHLKVNPSASYRVIGKDTVDIAYLPGTDSPLFYFELEALQSGKIYIILEITQDLGSVGSTRIVTTAAARKKPSGRVVAEIESHEPVPLEDVLAMLALLVSQIKDPTTRDQAAVAVRSLETEARQGEQANAGRVQLWLGVLENIAPEIWKAALAAFRQPVLGVGSVMRKVAEAETAQAGGG